MNERTAAAQAADTDDTGADDNTAMEERARRIGWVPKDEFRGDPDKWSEAADFLERGERTLPILLERNRKIDDKLGRVQTENTALKKQLDEMNGTLKEARDTFVEFRERTANVEQRAFDRARTEIREEMKAAVRAADPAAYDAAEAKLVELDKTAPKPVETARRSGERNDDNDDRGVRQERKPAGDAPQVSAAAQDWIEANPWFKADQKAGAKAVALHGTNLAMGMSEEDSLADVRLSMEAMRPDLFEDKPGNGRDDGDDDPRRGAAPVHAPSGNGARRRRGNGRSFDDLPAEARDAYARFHRQDPKFTKEDYLRDYSWD